MFIYVCSTRFDPSRGWRSWLEGRCSHPISSYSSCCIHEYDGGVNQVEECHWWAGSRPPRKHWRCCHQWSWKLNSREHLIFEDLANPWFFVVIEQGAVSVENFDFLFSVSRHSKAFQCVEDSFGCIFSECIAALLPAHLWCRGRSGDAHFGSHLHTFAHICTQAAHNLERRTLAHLHRLAAILKTMTLIAHSLTFTLYFTLLRQKLFIKQRPSNGKNVTKI